MGSQCWRSHGRSAEQDTHFVDPPGMLYDRHFFGRRGRRESSARGGMIGAVRRMTAFGLFRPTRASVGRKSGASSATPCPPKRQSSARPRAPKRRMTAFGLFRPTGGVPVADLICGKCHSSITPCVANWLPP
jgi:hypothetical protein